MNIHDQLAFINGSYYKQIDSQWTKIGIQAPGFVSSEIIDGNLIINYDSSFDILRNGLTPFINFTNVDSDGNSITWSASVNHTGSLNASLSIVGSSPQFSVVPSKAAEQHYKDNLVTFQTSSLPAFSMFDSDKQQVYNDLSRLEINLLYTYGNTTFITSNHNKAFSLVLIGSPLVNFFNNSVITPFSSNRGLHFNNNGTKLFVANNYQIKEYDLTSPYDTLTMSGTKTYTPHLYYGADINDLTFNDSGNKLYLLNSTSDNKIHEYDLNTPFDIDTILKRDNILKHIEINKDVAVVNNGSNLTSFSGGKVYNYELEENYNVSTWNNTSISNLNLPTYNFSHIEYRYPTAYERTYTGVYYNFIFTGSGAGGGYRWVSRWDHTAPPVSYCFSNNGKYLFWVTGLASYSGIVYRYELSNPWDITSVISTQTRLHTIGKATSNTYERNNKTNGVQCIRVSPDGTKLFLLDTYTHSIYQHEMTTPFNLISIGSTISNNSKIIAPNGGFAEQFYYTEVPNPNPTSSYNDTSLVRNFSFNHSGTKLYIANNSDVYEYNLTTPFSLSSVTYVTSYNTFSSTISSVNGGIFITDSDQRLYSYSNDIVRQYNLDSNLNTVSDPFKDKEFDVSLQDNDPTGIYFNNNGNTLYMSGRSTNNVFKYSLTDKDKLYSASYDSEYSTPALVTNLEGIVTNTAENKMYLLSDRSIVEVDINSQFSASTDPGVSYGTVKGNTINMGMRWNGDGTLFIVSGNSTLETYKTDNPYRVIPI